jgi:hypothetical protein
MRAPAKPGRYVVRVNIGLSFESASMRVFEVSGK